MTLLQRKNRGNIQTLGTESVCVQVCFSTLTPMVGAMYVYYSWKHGMVVVVLTAGSILVVGWETPDGTHINLLTTASLSIKAH